MRTTNCEHLGITRQGPRDLHVLHATGFHAGILRGLFTDPEDGGDVLRNVGWLSTDYNGVISQMTEFFITTAV
jgi:hypothetical protein